MQAAINNYHILTNNYIRPRTHEYKQIEYEQQGSAKRDKRIKLKESEKNLVV